MIRLDSTARSLQAVLGGAVATTEPDVTVSYVEASNPVRPGAKTGTVLSSTNGNTAVTICYAPENLVVREIDSVILHNNDTATVSATVQFNDNGTAYKYVTVALLTGETLFYTNGTGWRVLNADGQIKE